MRLEEEAEEFDKERELNDGERIKDMENVLILGLVGFYMVVDGVRTFIEYFD